MDEELKVQETNVYDYMTGSTFQFSFDVDDGPIRNILFNILKNRKITIAPTSDGKGVKIYSKNDRVEE